MQLAKTQPHKNSKHAIRTTWTGFSLLKQCREDILKDLYIYIYIKDWLTD